MNSHLKIDFYRQRNFGEAFSDTFAFVFRNIFPLTKAVLIFVGPMVLIYGVIVGLATYGLMSRSATGLPLPDADTGMIFGSGITAVMVVLGILMGLAFYLTLNSYILRYAESLDGRVRLQDIWEDIKAHWSAFLGITLVRGIIYVAIFAINFFIPLPFITFVLSLLAIYFLTSTSFSDIIRMNEGGGVRYALMGSFELINKRWWQTFLLYVLVGLIATVTFFVIYMILGLFVAFFVQLIGTSMLASILLVPVGLVVVLVLYTGLLATLWTASSLQYFSLSGAESRGSEAHDLIDEIGQEHRDEF